MSSSGFRFDDQMSTMKIFDTYQKSPVDVQEVIRNSRISISELLIENYIDMIHISLATNGKNFSGWIVYDAEMLEGADDDELEPIRVGRTEYPHSDTDREGELTLWHVNRLTGAFLLLKHLFEIFTGPIKKTTLITATIPRPDISQFLKDIFQYIESINTCESVTIFEKGRSSVTMIDEILDSATGMKQLDLRCPLPDSWRNTNVLKIDSLVAWPAEWFTRDDLLNNLDCEYANLNETNLEWRDFKEFMEQWKRGKDTKLKALEVSFDGDWDGFETDGLAAKEWDPEQRDSHYPDLLRESADWQNCKHAMDIQRPDGLLASFWRREHSFHFVVWHDRHPIATLQPDPELLVELEPDQFVSDEEEEEEDEEEEE